MIEYDNETIYTIEEIKEKLSLLLSDNQQFLISKIILFGSYAKGTAEPNSDLDFIICDSPKIKAMNFFYLLGELKELFKKEVDLFIDKNIDKESELYKNILKEGIEVYDKQVLQ